MENWFAVDYLDVERLLSNWRWLCPKPMALVAKNSFADLFLRNESGEIFRLDVAGGKLTKVAASEVQFCELAATPEKRREWFAEVRELAELRHGMIEKPLKPFRISLGDRRVYTTFCKGFQTFGKTETEPMQ